MKRYVIISLTIIILLSLTVFAATPVMAADFRGDDTVTVASGEVIDDDLYIGGADIVIDGTVNGDVWAAGNNITINGVVNGSVVLVGQTIIVNGDITGSAKLVGTNTNVYGNIGGDLIAGGSYLTIGSKAAIGRDFVFGAGIARIDGLVDGNIKGGGGDISLAGTVAGDIELDVDTLTVDATADIQGNLTYTSENEVNIASGARIMGTTTQQMPEVKESAKAAPFAGVVGNIIAYLMTLLTGIVIVLLAPRKAVTIAATLRQKPWLSLGWGAIVFFATPLAALVVLITVVGIPVALISLTLYALAIYLSQIIAGLFIGYLIIVRFNKVESRGMLIAE